MRMADDLEQFFAKKQQRAKEKKNKGIINIDAVGQLLERKAKRQEELDREVEEKEKRQQEDEQFFRRQIPEDPEWLDYNDPNQEMQLSDFGLKDMNLIEQVEVQEEEEKSAVSEPARTWNLSENNNECKPIDKLPSPDEPSKKAYVPAYRRNIQLSRAKVDIENQEMFPSLAAADQMEKQQRLDEKREEQRKQKFKSNKGKNQNEHSPSPVAQPQNSQSDKFIPLHRRQNCADPPSTNASSNAWSRPRN